MDPDANLNRQRELVGAIAKLAGTPAEVGDAHAVAQSALASLAAELAELVSALDGWITAGGFLPARWAGAVLVKRSLVP